jgi:hypothetical protein
MKSALTERFEIEFPLFAFTHCRDVVVEVTNAGGFGVLGAVAHTPETLEIDLAWIDARIKGPYGVDLLIPSRMEDKEGALTTAELQSRVPPGHRQHIEKLLEKHGIDASDLWTSNWANDYSDNMREGGAQKLLDVAFAHPIKLFVNALGPPPKSVVDRCRAQGVAVGALTGAREHAMKNVAAGVEILVVSGTEAGGHCGEISTMVVVPDVIDAIKEHPNVHVVAAGGIATGRFGMAHDSRSRNHPDGQGQDARRFGARHGPLAEPHGKADAPAQIAMDRGLGRCQSRAARDASAGPHQPPSTRQGRQARRGRTHGR